MSFRPITRVAVVLAILLVFGLVAAVPAQVKVKPSADEKAAAERAAEEDPALQAHIAYLIERIEHKNRIIRRSAHQGLTGVGQAALPALNGLAADQSTNRGKVAARLVKTIEKRIERQANRADQTKTRKTRKTKKRQQPAALTEEDVVKALTAAGADASSSAEVMKIIQEHRGRMRAIKKEMRGADASAAREKRVEAMDAYLGRLGAKMGQGKAALFLRALDRQRAGTGPRKARKPRSDRKRNAGDA